MAKNDISYGPQAGGGRAPQGQQAPQLTPQMMQSAKTMVCDECGSHYFKQVVVLQRISKIMTGQDKDTVVPVSTFRCDDCGHVPEDYRPVTNREKGPKEKK